LKVIVNADALESGAEAPHSKTLARLRMLLPGLRKYWTAGIVRRFPEFRFCKRI
jgi:hypothetical protein